MSDTAGSLRALLADIIEWVQVRGALLGVETRLESGRVLATAVFAACAAVLACFFIVFAAMLLTVLFWDGHRLLVLGILTGVFFVGTLATAWLARRSWRSGQPWFAVTRAELQRDKEWLRRP